MRYLSVCSGIEAATVAWHPLGWVPAAYAEIDPFACELLHYRYGCGRPMFMPDPAEPGLSAKDKKARAAAIKSVAHLPKTPNPGCPPNLGDLNRFQEWPDLGSVDLLVGGTPCQSFSVAGLREGLADPRGNLALVFLAIAAKYGVRWCLWENVPGVLSSDGGRAFGSIVGGMAQLGYGVAYRVLDAQYCRAHGLAGAVPQRRRRVFVIGHLGDWRRSAAVLFDRESLLGNPPPRRQSGQRPAPTIAARTRGGGGLGTDFDLDGGLISMAHGQGGAEIGIGHGPTLTCNHEAPIVAHTLRTEGFDASEDGTGRGTPIVPVQQPAFAFDLRGREGGAMPEGPHQTANLRAASGGSSRSYVAEPIAFDCLAGGDTALAVGDVPGALHGGTAGGRAAIAFSQKDYGADAGEIAPTLRAMGHGESHANAGGQVAVAIQERAVCENPKAGPDGAGVRTDGAAYTLEARTTTQAVAFQNRVRGDDGRGYDRAPTASVEVCGTLETVKQHHVALPWAVRRLMPIECERLQGFPDDWTQIPRGNKPTADGPRYKALGNSMAVNVMRVLGERIALVASL